VGAGVGADGEWLMDDLRGKVTCQFVRVREFSDPDVAEVDLVAVAEEADMALLPREARMLAAIGRRLSVTKRRQVGSEDLLPFTITVSWLPRTVTCSSFHSTDRLQTAAFRRHDAIDRAVHLPGLEAGILRMAVVEDLELDPLEGRVSLGRSPEAEAVVGARRESEVEPELEVAVFGRCQQVAADAGPRANLAVDHLMTVECSLPAGQRFSVEERDEPILGCDRCGFGIGMHFSDLQPAEFHRGPFRFEAKIPACRGAVGTPRDLVAVHPEPNHPLERPG
jgi:hypothetical protein